MRVLVTGAGGFIATNLRLALEERSGYEVLAVVRGTPEEDLRALAARADAVVHLAGVNRPRDEAEFATGNAGFTRNLCALLKATGRPVPVAYASSTQAELDNPYGASKREGEKHLLAYAAETGAGVAVYRLPGVFGKWCRPHYNSVVATFCHNAARGLPLRIDDPGKRLRLVYIDDVVSVFLRFLAEPPCGAVFPDVRPVYETTVGELASRIEGFARGRRALEVGPVGRGFERALYATFVSHLPPGDFAYAVPRHADPRGVFVEMLKTEDSGQVSFFSARPGVTRGGHYHHTKTEKFLVVHGRARFRFRNLRTEETVTLEVTADTPTIVESVPGWAHDVTNTGDGDLLVLLWSNEVFDPARPDTVTSPLGP